jgi:signal transduction histidine kinase
VHGHETIGACAAVDTARVVVPEGEGRRRPRRARHGTALDELRRLMRPSSTALDDLGLVVRRVEAPTSAGLARHRRALESRPTSGSPELETAFSRRPGGVEHPARHAARHGAHPRGGGRVRIEIEDDGRGFEPSSIVPRPDNLRGLGLLGMRERVELFDGHIDIDSAPGQGTHVVIDVAVPETDHGQDQGPHRG